MVPRQDVLQLDLRAVRLSTGGSFCHERQFTIASFRLSLPRQIGGGCGRSFLGLGGLVPHLSLSSPPDSPGRDLEVERVSGNGDLGGPLLAVCSLVHRPTFEVPVEGSPSPLPLALSGHFQGQGLVSPCERFKPSRLGTIESCLRDSAYSAHAVHIMLQQHRSSSARQYQSVWSKFLSFLDSNRIIHKNVSLVDVLNFLAFQVQVFGRKYRTIAVYRCALKHPLYYRLGLVIDTLESDTFMRGLFNFRTPARCAPMPSWSLDDLLHFLLSDTFEPLEQVSWKR